MSRKPVAQLDIGQAFYARLFPDLDITHFGALWHLFTVGHLVAADLDSIARTMGCSFADLDLLGTLAIDSRRPMRATDLASTLHVSNAVVSTRVVRLVAAGLIERQEDPTDRRAYQLTITDTGRATVEQAIRRIAEEAKIVRYFRRMPADEQRELVRMLGYLHQQFDRDFPGGPYTQDVDI